MSNSASLYKMTFVNNSTFFQAAQSLFFLVTLKCALYVNFCKKLTF